MRRGAVRVDELVLHGVPRTQAPAVRAAVEHALVRLLDERPAGANVRPDVVQARIAAAVGAALDARRKP
jgi:hypothetical protein